MSGETVILVVGRRLALPWNFADDELGTCAICDGLVRYRPLAGGPNSGGVLACPGCVGPPAAPGDVWILPGELGAPAR